MFCSEAHDALRNWLISVRAGRCTGAPHDGLFSVGSACTARQMRVLTPHPAAPQGFPVIGTDAERGRNPPVTAPGQDVTMKPNAHVPAAADLSCEVCGQMPEPTKTRLTVANVAVMLPIELLVHALGVENQLPYVAKGLVLTLTATILVIWVAEPSAARVLRGWLHAPALRHRRKLGTAPALWRARTVLRDEPGSLQKVTKALARPGTHILSIHL